MLNHFDMQRKAIEAARDLMVQALHNSNTSGLATYRELRISARHFPDDVSSELLQIEEHVASLETLRATDDKTPDGEAGPISDKVAAEEDWLEAKLESFDNQFKRFLTPGDV